ncbi:MAG: hypothetical protein ACK56F_18710 [bacterium]
MSLARSSKQSDQLFLLNTFKFFDTNNDELIDRTQFFNAIGKIGYNLSDHKVKEGKWEK